MKKLILIIFGLVSLVTTVAQNINVYTSNGFFYQFPYDKKDTIKVVDSLVNFRYKGVDTNIEQNDIDSVTFEDVDFQNAKLHITTEGSKEITSRDTFMLCHYVMEGGSLFKSFESDGNIRGRGNSTWSWYDGLIYGRRPYRIKFDKKTNVLGLPKSKDWILLANWRDGSFMMNAFTNELGRYLGFPFNCHNRFCEVYINNEYNGLYQICEQIERDEHRVDISDAGVIVSLDADDGPDLSPTATNNFWSSIYYLPVAVKFPKDEDLTAEKMTAIKQDFNMLESLVNKHIYANVAARLDIKSLIDFLIVQELTCNVELDAPRSMYMYRDSLNVWHFGPLWDFDAGFDFDWSDMYTGHTYYTSQKLLYGTNPANYPTYGTGTRFFLRMFKNSQFVTEYKKRWVEVKDNLVASIFTNLDNYKSQIAQAQARNAVRWPIYWRDGVTKIDYDSEYSKFKKWITARISVMTTAINSYPVGN
jgi:spore coat protein CotH